jgi:hypothetical protein
MFAMLKSIFGKLAGPGGGGDAPDGPPAPTVEYKGYRIRPAPYPANGQFQTAGVIEKYTAEGLKEHRFVRADTHATRQDAIDFAVSKAKQIIDSQAETMFG